MRENMGLYHGKRKDNGEWVVGWYCRVPYGRWPLRDTIIPNEEAEAGHLTHIEVIPETVGQYILETDKNGVWIFEGDILRYFDDEIQVVEWNDEVRQIMLHTYAEHERKAGRKTVKEKCEGWHYLNDYPLNEMSIIGNIHDNPELLEVEHT